jgi:serine/threonine-protein kinase
MLRSQHVVKVFDFDVDEQGIPFIVMEHLHGETLSEVVKRGALTPARTMRIALQITAALEECRAAGILHCDLKPRNILLCQPYDFVKLLDFGIACMPDDALWQPGLGTPRYMPPEQIRQVDLDERVDIFALGVILFECLCGEPPILAKRPMDYLLHNVERAPRKLRSIAPHLPRSLEALLEQMMAKDRAQRPRSVIEVESRLRAIASRASSTPVERAVHCGPVRRLRPPRNPVLLPAEVRGPVLAPPKGTIRKAAP